MIHHIACLDKGFVRLEQHVGGDQAVVRSARVSYSSTAKTAEDDREHLGRRSEKARRALSALKEASPC